MLLACVGTGSTVHASTLGPGRKSIATFVAATLRFTVTSNCCPGHAWDEDGPNTVSKTELPPTSQITSGTGTQDEIEYDPVAVLSVPGETLTTWQGTASNPRIAPKQTL
jgi:hypothetical protein